MVANLSATRLKTVFRNSTDTTVHQYVSRHRVEYARSRIATTRMPPGEIAIAAGFAHQSHMTTTMRRLLGQTPGEIVRETSDFQPKLHRTPDMSDQFACLHTPCMSSARKWNMFAIIGATRKVGYSTSMALRTAGLPVRATLRDAPKAGPLHEIGCDIALADLQDPAALAWAIAKADAVQIILPPPPQAEDAPGDCSDPQKLDRF